MRPGENIRASIQNIKIPRCRPRRGLVGEKLRVGWWRLSRLGKSLSISRSVARSAPQRGNKKVMRRMFANVYQAWELALKWVLGGFLLVTLVVTAAAESGNVRHRYASASSDACVASCSSTNTECKRVCPAVLGATCLASCDSQYQSCTRSCQSK